eukprot:6392124-Prymnesium_polylepis.1
MAAEWALRVKIKEKADAQKAAEAASVSLRAERESRAEAQSVAYDTALAAARSENARALQEARAEAETLVHAAREEAEGSKLSALTDAQQQLAALREEYFEALESQTKVHAAKLDALEKQRKADSATLSPLRYTGFATAVAAARSVAKVQSGDDSTLAPSPRRGVGATRPRHTVDAHVQDVVMWD